jgi:hypothetical protein
MKNMVVKLSQESERLINLEKLSSVWKTTCTDPAWPYRINYLVYGKEINWSGYSDKELRDKDFRKMEQVFKKEKKENMMESIRNYFKNHQETFLTICVLLLADEYLFDGVFREKIKDLIESFINKTKRKIENVN